MLGKVKRENGDFPPLQDMGSGEGSQTQKPTAPQLGIYEGINTEPSVNKSK